MSILIFIAGICIGILSGFLAAQFFSNKKLGEERRNLERANANILDLTAKLSNANAERQHYEKMRNELREDRKSQENYLSELRTQTKTELKTEFKNLANEILETKSKDLSEQSKNTFSTILAPFQEKLTSFEKIVHNTYVNEANERFALKSEVARLIGLNDAQQQTTKALTQALLGNSKTQGNWGELVLERILEESGLINGQQYLAQKSHENNDGDRMQPDIIIKLPEDKHLIIDSKMSLTSYELYCRNEDEMTKRNALSLHLKSLHKHIDELHDKHYSKLKGIHSPDFVFAFIPVEAAYILAMKSDPDLAMKAWRKKVAIVTATTLLTSLQTVASIWRLEKQNKNTREIVSQAEELYNKFVGFLDDFKKIEKAFETGREHYSNALSKLKDGRGNIIRKIEHLRMLGAHPKNRIPQEFLDTADSDSTKKSYENIEEPEKPLLSA